MSGSETEPQILDLLGDFKIHNRKTLRLHFIWRRCVDVKWNGYMDIVLLLYTALCLHSTYNRR